MPRETVTRAGQRAEGQALCQSPTRHPSKDLRCPDSRGPDVQKRRGRTMRDTSMQRLLATLCTGAVILATAPLPAAAARSDPTGRQLTRASTSYVAAELVPVPRTRDIGNPAPVNVNVGVNANANANISNSLAHRLSICNLDSHTCAVRVGRRYASRVG